MQIHEIGSKIKLKKRKKVGRGGKRGVYSGRGMDGQRKRSGGKKKNNPRVGRKGYFKSLPRKSGRYVSKKSEPAVVRIDILSKNVGKFKDKKIGLKDLQKAGLIKKGFVLAKLVGPKKEMQDKDLLKGFDFGKGIIMSKTVKEIINK